MNDDPLDPRHELASAYLDGEVGEVERARVEASPEVLDLVARLTAVRTAIGEAPAAPSGAADAAVTAALAEFDRLAAPATHGRNTVVRPSRWRTLQWRVLTGAAAAAVVALVGVAVFSDGRDASFKSSGAPEVARSLDSAGGAPAADQNADMPRPTIGDIMGAAEAMLVVTSPAELLALAEPGRAAPTTDGATLAAVPCAAEGQDVVAQVIYIDTPAVVVRDPSTGVVRALDTATCAVIVEVTP
jgi:hypothetical protein